MAPCGALRDNDERDCAVLFCGAHLPAISEVVEASSGFFGLSDRPFFGSIAPTSVSPVMASGTSILGAELFMGVSSAFANLEIL